MVKLMPSSQINRKSKIERDSYNLKLITNTQNNVSMDFDQSYGGMQGLSQSTEKWNPLTFAIYVGNLELIKFILSKYRGNVKKLLNLPGIFKTQEVSRLYPFVMSMRFNNNDMFKFFWEELSYVYCNEETFTRLFRLLAKRDKPELINYILSSEATQTLFLSMSYSYRLEFINDILQIKTNILIEFQQVILEQNHESSSGANLDNQPSSPFNPPGNNRQKQPVKNRIADSDSEMNSMAMMGSSAGSSMKQKESINDFSDEGRNIKSENQESLESFDPQEFLHEKKQSLDHFFFNVYEQLSKAPYSMMFYLSLTKFVVKQGSLQDQYVFELMRRTLKNISEDEIDLFLYYDTEAAISIVQDLIEKQQVGISQLSKIDNEVKNLANRIKKSPNFNLYKNALKRQTNKNP